MTTEALKPCPFCGAEAEIERYGAPRQSTIYACTECGCRLETGEEWNYGARWNTRPTPLAPWTRDLPDGWKLVPATATLEMQHAYFDEIDRNMKRVETDCAFGRFSNHASAYVKMLAAAPLPPLQTEES